MVNLILTVTAHIGAAAELEPIVGNGYVLRVQIPSVDNCERRHVGTDGWYFDLTWFHDGLARCERQRSITGYQQLTAQINIEVSM